jgi:uncharacterized integral membrane protein
MAIVMLIAGLLIALIALVFALQNSDMITVTFLFWETGEVSLALVLLLTFALGFIVSQLVTLPGIIRRSRQIRSHKKKLDEVDKLLDKDKVKEAGRE